MSKTLRALIADRQPPGVGLAAWQAERVRLKSAWLDFLGPPTTTPDLAVTVLEAEQMDGYLRQCIEFASEPHATQAAYLLLPDRAHEPDCPPLPAIVYFHATHDSNYLVPVGLAGEPARHHAVHLARRGWVVIVPRNFVYGYRDHCMEQAVKEFQRSYPQRLGMSKMLWNGMRCVDVLSRYDFVDASRISAMGHSLGAKEALFLAAFDERIGATVASEGGIGLDFSNWDAPWYLGEGIRQPAFVLEHHQLLALTAPRAFLLIGGNSADGEQSRPYVEAAHAVYDLYGASAQLRLVVHDAGHAWPAGMFAAACDWLEQRLVGTTSYSSR